MMFGLKTLGGPRDIVLEGGPDPPQRRGGRLGKISPIMDPLHISQTAKARDLKFGMPIKGWGP